MRRVGLLYSLLKCVELLSCGISDVGGRLYLKTVEMNSKGGVWCMSSMGIWGIMCIFRGRLCTAWLISTCGMMCGGQTVES